MALNENKTKTHFLFVDENCYIEIKHLCVLLSLMSFFTCLKCNIILVSGSGDKCAPPFIKNCAHFYSGGVAKGQFISKCLLGVIVSTKKHQRNFFQNFCPKKKVESKNFF